MEDTAKPDFIEELQKEKVRVVSNVATPKRLQKKRKLTRRKKLLLKRRKVS